MMAGPAAGLAVGLRAAVQHVVTDNDTAIAFGSGDVPVLATPRLLALAEAATVAAIAPHLGGGLTSVGTAARLEHRSPSRVGAELTVEAELTGIDGRRLVFLLIAREAGQEGNDEREVVGAGTVERVIVDRARFLARLGG
jgi:fluoroacetyl-CoA thioesterase